MKANLAYIAIILSLWLSATCSAQNEVININTSGNPVLSDVTADDTTRWGQSSAVADSSWDEIDVNDSARISTLKLTGKSLADTFALIILPTGIIDTASLVPTASWALTMPLMDFKEEYEIVMKRGELPLPLMKNNNIRNYHRLRKPYTASDVQLQAEIEKLYRRMYELMLRVDELEVKLK